MRIDKLGGGESQVERDSRVGVAEVERVEARGVGEQDRAAGLEDVGVVAVAAVGPRERIVLVRVGDAQVLVGIGAGGVVSLTPLASPVSLHTSAPPAPFAERLRDIMKRPGGAA